MRFISGALTRLALAMGLTATLYVIIGGRYWALPLCAVVLLIDVAAMLYPRWPPRLVKWLRFQWWLLRHPRAWWRDFIHVGPRDGYFAADFVDEVEEAAPDSGPPDSQDR